MTRRRGNATRRPTSRNSNHHPPAPSESNHSEANSVTTPASAKRQPISQRLNSQTTGRLSGGRSQRYPMGGASVNNTATGSQAPISRPSVTLPRLTESRTPEPPARPRARELALLQYHLSVYEDVLDAHRRLMGLLERRAIDHGRRIEHGDVGVHPRPHETAIGQTDPLRRQRSHLPHGELEGEQLQVARVVAEDPRERPVGARMRGLRAERTVGRHAAEIGIHRHPPLFHR